MRRPTADDRRTAPRTFEFGPFDLAPSRGDDGTASRSRWTTTTLFVNAVELTTGPGFHHSNWFFVPEHVFAGDGRHVQLRRRATSTSRPPRSSAACCSRSRRRRRTRSRRSPMACAISPAALEARRADPPAQPGRRAAQRSRRPSSSRRSPRPTSPPARRHVVREPGARAAAEQAVEVHRRVRPRRSATSYIFGREPDFKIYYALAHYHELGTGLTSRRSSPTARPPSIYTTENKSATCSAARSIRCST